MNLLTVNGHATRLSRSQLISAGGTDFRLGSLRAPQLRRWAIVVGVDAYPPPFQSLKYAANDAKAVKETLQEAGFMVTLMTPDSLLQPTKENIIHQLEWHGQLEEIDLLTVYLSGHGEDVGGTGYFLPMDVTDPLAQSGLSMEDMFALLNTANAKHRFVIVDACRIAPKQHFITALSRYSEESNIIFTACDSNQWAPEVPRLKHGLFTYFLLKGLRGSSERDRGAAASDGTVTVLGLLDYVTRGIEDWHAHLPTDLRMPQQITPRVFYNGKYISLLNNQGINPMLLNNRGLASRFIDWISPITSTPSIGPQNGQKQYTHMPVTISFVPGVSTAGPVGRNVVTNLSFNILAGYSAKLDGLEFGGIANLQKEEARGAQFAGVANLVGGYVEGFQAAGVFNVAHGDLNGLQASGSANYAKGNVRVGQLSGAINVALGDFNGLQGSGAVNYAGRGFEGGQLSGAINATLGNFNGLQGAGAVNVASNLEGAQLSVVNISGGLIGAQIGVVNIARKVEGLQLGVVNVSESMSGAPIGVLSFVKDSPLRLHFWGSDTDIANVGLRLGSRYVYNLLMVGIQPDEDPVRWSYGLGIGGHIPLNEKFFLNIDAVSRDIQYGRWEEEANVLSKLRLGVGWQPYPRFTVLGGVALNVFVSDERDGSDIAYGLDTVIESGDTTIRIWPGFFLGVRF